MVCRNPDCPLFNEKRVKTRGIEPMGPMNAPLYIIGEAPGRQEDEHGFPFVGRSGHLLRGSLKQIGVPEECIRINNACRCAPWRNSDSPGKPKASELKACKDSILSDIFTVNPRCILLLGSVAVESFLGITAPMKAIRGTSHTLSIGPNQYPCVVAYHPAFLLRKNIPEQLLVEWLLDMSTAWKLCFPDSQEQVQKDYRILDNLADVKAYIDFLVSSVSSGNAPFISLDIEGSDLNPFDPNSYLLLFGLSHTAHQGYIIPVEHYASPFSGKKKELSAILKPLEMLPIVGQNLLFDWQWMKTKLDIELKNMVFDTFLANHCMYQSTRDNDLESLAAYYLQEPAWSWQLTDIVSSVRMELLTKQRKIKSEVKKAMKEGKLDDKLRKEYEEITRWCSLAKQGIGYAVAPLDKLSLYCARDVDVTWRLVSPLYAKLQSEGLWDTYVAMYVRKMYPWACIRYDGIQIDGAAIENHIKEMEEHAEEILKSFNNISVVAKLAKKLHLPGININSPQQISILLYDILGCEAEDDRHSTEAAVIEKLLSVAKKDTTSNKSSIQAEVLSHIQEYRTTTKMLSSYVKGLKECVIDGKVHPTWNIAGTDTGRASASDPPIHSQPEALRDVICSRYADIGGCILGFDQSQIEVRVFAEIANDSFLIDTYNKVGSDVHRMVASLIFGGPAENVTKEQRQIAKTCVFASLYGGGPKRIAEAAGISYEEAASVYNRFASIVNIRGFSTKMWNELQTRGYIVTPIFGRRRVIPILDETHQYHARNQAVNTPIQSVASDITFEAIERLWWRMYQTNMKSKIIIWHHDAIVWDVYPGELFALINMAYAAMVDEPKILYKLRVPLDIEGGFGYNWRDKLKVLSWGEDFVETIGSPENYKKLLDTSFGSHYQAKTISEGEEGVKMVFTPINKTTH